MMNLPEPKLILIWAGVCMSPVVGNQQRSFIVLSVLVLRGKLPKAVEKISVNS
jgi:hypothetical protein